MPLPKTLTAHPDYADDVCDANGKLVFQVYGSIDNGATLELRDEIIHRWNSFETIAKGIAELATILDEAASKINA